MNNADLALSGLTLLPDGSIIEAAIQISRGSITQVSAGGDPKADLVTGGTIVPGFIDMQLNGAFGYDFTTDGSTVAAVAQRLPATGVTAFMPTVITSPFGVYPVRLREVAEAIRIANGAQPLGLHLEGPYINPVRRGAHDPAYMRPIDVEEMLNWADPAVVRIVTLAPELPGAMDAIRALRRSGILVSIGHTNATFGEALAGFEAGAGWGTHLFNAMSALHHREPGVPGAIFASTIPCGLIADGIHTHPAMVELAYRVKGPAGITLVTDAMEAMGMPPGSYRLGDREVRVTEERAELIDGTLAGSILEMDAAVRNVMAFTGCSLAQAVTMATRTPARVLGLERKGAIAAGYDADLVILDPSLQVSSTFIGGKLVYHRES